MRMQPFMCLGGLEIGNGERTRAYLQSLAGAQWNVHYDASPVCAALLDVDELDVVVPFVSPADDPAPWYDAAVPASAEFLGFLPGRIETGEPLQRDTLERVGEGGYLGPEQLLPRVLDVTGLLTASSAEGMAYGKAWLIEALRGCDGCGGRDLQLLKACPDAAAGSASDPYFRTMVSVEAIRLLPPTGIGNLAECYILETNVQLQSELPWFYSPPVTVMDEVSIGPDETVNALTSVNEWPGDSTLRMTVTAGAGDVSGVVISARQSFDEECPPYHLSLPCFVYRTQNMTQDGVLTIDGARRQVTYRDAADKRELPGFRYLDAFADNQVQGDLWEWPDVAACSHLCLTVDNFGDAAVTVTVERWDREF